MAVRERALQARAEHLSTARERIKAFGKEILGREILEEDIYEYPDGTLAILSNSEEVDHFIRIDDHGDARVSYECRQCKSAFNECLSAVGGDVMKVSVRTFYTSSDNLLDLGFKIAEHERTNHK